MALTIYRSNRVEMLQARLVQRLAATPLTDPFATEVVVVPTYAMGRWLNLNFARQQGIAANFDYPQLGEWVWSLAGQLLDDIPQQDPYSRESLGWSIFNTLPDLLRADRLCCSAALSRRRLQWHQTLAIEPTHRRLLRSLSILSTRSDSRLVAGRGAATGRRCCGANWSPRVSYHTGSTSCIALSSTSIRPASATAGVYPNASACSPCRALHPLTSRSCTRWRSAPNYCCFSTIPPISTGPTW